MLMNRFSIEEGPPRQSEIDYILKSIDDRENVYRTLKIICLVLAGVSFLGQILGFPITPVWWIGPLLLFAILIWCSKSGLQMRRDYEPLDDQGRFELKALMGKSPLVKKYVNASLREDEDEDESEDKNENRGITWGEFEMLKSAAYYESLNPDEEMDTYSWE